MQVTCNMTTIRSLHDAPLAKSALRHPCCGWIGRTHIQLNHGIGLSGHMRLQELSSE
jgi:hypothetical protein